VLLELKTGQVSLRGLGVETPVDEHRIGPVEPVAFSGAVSLKGLDSPSLLVLASVECSPSQLARLAEHHERVAGEEQIAKFGGLLPFDLA
jgi:hypothetical protein